MGKLKGTDNTSKKAKKRYSQKIQCAYCERFFVSSRALSLHWQQSPQCNDALNNTNNHTFYNEFPDDTDLSSFDANNNESFLAQDNNQFVEKKKKFLPSQLLVGTDNVNNIRAKIELLKLLNKSKAPLYLFDSIMSWTKKAVNEYDLDFGNDRIVSRQKLVQELKIQFDLKGIEPFIKTVQLRGSNNQTEIVLHSFKEMFYSLLNDKELMNPNNLLIDETDIFDESIGITQKETSKVYNDIDTGSVYKKGREIYLNTHGDTLCPIIFFIDKTHTDVNGRLCLEPIRFTLGIFNRETRNNPKAWRTLGYIPDQAQMKKCKPLEKAIDYHHIMEIILEDFKKSQKERIQWTLELNDNKRHTVFFKIPVLFIIGDTEGHDKISGRFTSRANIKRLCRCCNIPFEETDNPQFKFKLHKHKTVMEQVSKGTTESLRKISMHKLSNAWADVDFCDPERGLYGALCGDLMHCLQHGLFMYLIQMLFDQKKVKTVLTDAEKKQNRDILSNRCAFPESYCAGFDTLCRVYGKLLMHQSDRSLSRTHFHSSYVSTARKNANEMSGILLVYLMVFNSSEGRGNIDRQLGEGRNGDFIQLIESMLMLENCCHADDLKSSNLKLLNRFMPYVLNMFKDTLNRQVGCKMKIIKFHLPIHFPNDIIRFGSMQNFDTGIGESHHKTESKLPAKNTQRRRSNFEYQTALRNVDNIAINMAHANMDTIETETDDTINDIISKWYRYIYDQHKKLCWFKKNTKKRQLLPCRWKDTRFQKQIESICHDIIENKCLNGPIRFFAQHNRGNYIFRADPCYDKNGPWYDWAFVHWEGHGNIPAKLLLFMDISDDEFLKPFDIGSTSITGSGQYVIAYSLASTKSSIGAHGKSVLVQYAKIDPSIDLCVFPVESIFCPVTAVPYQTNTSIVDAEEWILLSPKEKWNEIFFKFMKDELAKKK
jgi:hypothetical protein